MLAPVIALRICRLSVMFQNWWKVHHKFTISGASFLPKSDVSVRLVQLIALIDTVIPLPFKMGETFVPSLFHFRQKYSYKCIRTLLPLKVRGELNERIFKQAEIKSTICPFQLTVPEIGRLCPSYKTIDRQSYYYYCG